MSTGQNEMENSSAMSYSQKDLKRKVSSCLAMINWKKISQGH